MGISNYLIDGVSGTGKTSVATELAQRGYHVIHGDRELAYRGDPNTGEPLNESAVPQASQDAAFRHAHHLWDVSRVKALVADRSHPTAFFCGGSRNFQQFIDLFDGVFVLDVDLKTLNRRLAGRDDDEFGTAPDERAVVLRAHATGEDVPRHATIIDATAPLAVVVDLILAKCKAGGDTGIDVARGRQT